MTPLVLLIHGWGFDADFWRPLREALGAVDTLAWDLGFFGPPAQPVPAAGRPIIAVGHSFGSLWLLHHRPLRWRRLIAINGFSRFAIAADFPHGIPRRRIHRMESGLAEHPLAVVNDFRRRCGAAPALGPIDGGGRDRLQAALGGLAGWDTRPPGDRSAAIDRALCGRSDPIVPAAMSADAFPGAAIAWHSGGHLLPLEDPLWCARQIHAVWESAA